MATLTPTPKSQTLNAEDAARGRTALMHAAAAGRMDICTMLIRCAYMHSAPSSKLFSSQ